MKLFTVKRNSYVKILPDPDEGTRVPPAAPDMADGEVVLFKSIDGMYSFCVKQDGTVCHLVAWHPVKVVPKPKGGGFIQLEACV
jgi:hypothetical protein